MAIVPNDRPTPASTHINGTNQSPIDKREKRVRDLTADDQDEILRETTLSAALSPLRSSCRSIVSSIYLLYCANSVPFQTGPSHPALFYSNYLRTTHEG